MRNSSATLKVPDGSAALARQIKATRTARGVTLADLSATVGLDKGYLSKVERGLKMPSISTLMKIGSALSIPVSQLFGESVDDKLIHVSRGSQRVATVAEDGHSTQSLTTGQGREGLEGFVFFPPAKFLDDMRAQHSGEELLYVISGSIEIRFVDRTIALDTTDSVQFAGHLQHQVRRTSRAASILVVISRS